MSDEELQFADDDLLDAARLGIDIEVFTKSPAGMALVDRAMNDLRDNLMILLGEADPAGDRARKAHLEARTAHRVIQYLSKYIEDGENAVMQLNEEDDHGE